MTRPSFDERSAEVKEHERRAVVILDGLCQFVALLNPRGDILEVNRATLEGAGHRIEDIRGKPFWTARWWQISEQIRKDLQRAINRAAAGEFVRYEVDIYGEQSGRVPITIDFSLQPIRGESGEVEYLLSEGRNITGRKRAEAASRQSEEWFRRLLDTLPVGAYICEAEGLITYFNERAVEAWGRRPELNAPVERFFGSYKLYSPDGAQLPHDQCWMALAIKEDKAYEGREIVIERPDGSRLTVLAHVNPFYNEAGQLLGAVNIVADITDRKKAEAVMAQMAAIVESTDDAIVGKDLNGIITSWNKGAQKLFGYTAEEVIGKSTTILIPPDRENEESYILDRIRRGEGVDHYETRRRRKEGREIDISLTISPILDKSGKVIGASKIARGISDRKRHERRLTEQARLLDLSNDAIIVRDLNGRITYWNHGAEEIYGWRSDEAVGKNLYELVRAEFSEPPEKIVEALLRDDRWSGESTRVRRDGARITVETRWSLDRDAQGRPASILQTDNDITERKQAEAAASRLAAIVEWSDDAIVGKDLNGIIKSWNKGAERVFGYAAEEVIGKPVTILIPPDRAHEEPRILERIRHGEQIEHYETVRHRKDGSEIDISLTVSPIRDESGKVIGASKIARDISERKRAEIEREEMLLKESAARAEAEAARAEAEAANHSKDEFLAVVSHELRAPLNAILGYNQMLREKTPDAAQLKSSCDVIERNAKAQLQLIEDLLDSARIASGKLRLELRSLDVNPVIADALDMMRLEAEAKGVRLLRVAEKDDAGQEESATRNLPPAIVQGDAARVQQIIWNLLSNAIKFTPAGGRVELRVERAEEHIRIIVSDTGNGILPEFMPYVFDRFRQADPSGSRRYGGLGLGLALVKRLVELHGGKVEVASEGAGRGSAFTVRLPLAMQNESAAAEPQALAAAAGDNGETETIGAIQLPAGITIAGLQVLVVDDQEEARTLLADFLGRYGAVVTTASSGAEALAILSNLQGGARPDILICDLAMPEEDGYTALRRMRALEEARGVAASQRIPAVALTALTGNEERLRAIRSGFQGHITKPVDPVELILMIDNIAGIWRRKPESN